MRLRICAPLLPLLLTCAANGADANPRREHEGLGAARQQLEALDAARTRDLLGGRNGLPSAPLPTLDATPSAPDPTPVIPRSRKLSPKKQRQEAEKSKNWLIDAMQEKKTSVGRNSDTTNGSRATEPSLTEEESLRAENWFEAETEEGSAERLDQREDRAQLAAEVVNPLSGYMAAWMTPRDFHVLQGTRLNAGKSTGSTNTFFQPATNLEITLPQGAFPPGASSDYAALPAISAPSSNPYLSEAQTSLLPPVVPERRELGASISPAGTNSGEPMSLSPTLAPQPQPASSSPTRAPLAESLRGSDDAKYFKQLKRF